MSYLQKLKSPGFYTQISAKNIKLYCSWNSSKFSIFQTKKPGFLEIIDLCFNLGIGFCITWLIYQIIKKLVHKNQFQINHASHLKVSGELAVFLSRSDHDQVYRENGGNTLRIQRTKTHFRTVIITNFVIFFVTSFDLFSL